jgi:signal transduction histidine kinase
MSVVAFPSKGATDHRIVLELATSEDLESGMTCALELLRGDTGAAKIEWWAADEPGGQLRRRAADGDGAGPPSTVSLGPAGELVFTRGELSRIQTAIAQIATVVRRRFAEEQLAREAGRLARQNQALQDFAALVAHELKTPLKAALYAAADGGRYVEQALDLVDSVLEAARGESSNGLADPSALLDAVLEELGHAGANIETDLPHDLPVGSTTLHVLLRNLVGNAISAQARHIRVIGSRCADSWSLVVEDDGVGLSAADGYSNGSGVGLHLVRRLVERIGGTLELTPGADGGARAAVAVGVAA